MSGVTDEFHGTAATLENMLRTDPANPRADELMEKLQEIAGRAGVPEHFRYRLEQLKVKFDSSLQR